MPTPLSSLITIRNTVSQPIFAAFLAGGAAGAVSRTVVSPLERLKILFQIQSAGRNEYKTSVGKGLMKMWKEEGWRGLMRGNGTNCVRIVPYSAVQFGSYNFYKSVRLIRKKNNREVDRWKNIESCVLMPARCSLQSPRLEQICPQYGDSYVVAQLALPLLPLHIPLTLFEHDSRYNLRRSPP